MNQDIKNIVLAVILSVIVLGGWQYFVESPKQQEIAKLEGLRVKTIEEKAVAESKLFDKISTNEESEASKRQDAGFVSIKTEKLLGSIALKGARFDDLKLTRYHLTVEEGSPYVTLFAPSDDELSYFAEFGWISPDRSTQVPNINSVWKSDNKVLEPGKPATLSWQNDKGIKFSIIISVEGEYLFTIKQHVENHSGSTIEVMPYGLINRKLIPAKSFAILHEGAIGTFGDSLQETSYDDLIEKRIETFNGKSGGWLGITDKYWLSAIVPDGTKDFKANFTASKVGVSDKYQVDYLGNIAKIPPQGNHLTNNHLFAGAKVSNLIDQYSKKYDIRLFDRAIDFGWLYFLTKPLLKLLGYFYSLTSNFGVSILLMTLLVKLVMFPLANKSYRSMNKMKQFQPEIEKLKEQHSNDKMKLNQAMMDLYKKEKINPMSGCLPLIIQLPVFFSLYKVIFVSIEMRHAPFFGWIKDLSAPDPTNMFNIFGLIPWDPPSFLHVGIWPIIMGGSMYLLQRMSPAPSDPIQAKVMKLLPFIFVFMFNTFPAGLMIYWSCSNLLSILQQWALKFFSDDKAKQGK